ncbi:MAG: hypothetical protein ABIG64_09500 [Candidatus Omnitrophota bacterium]
MDFYYYITLSNPQEVLRKLKSKGYATPRNTKELAYILKRAVQQHGKEFLYEIAYDLHPDKELIIEAYKHFETKEDKKETNNNYNLKDFYNFLQANGNGNNQNNTQANNIQEKSAIAKFGVGEVLLTGSILLCIGALIFRK